MLRIKWYYYYTLFYVNYAENNLLMPVHVTFYTPEVKLRTYYGVASVCPSVSHIMSAQYLEKFLSDSHGTW